jgi:hypothetical protein
LHNFIANKQFKRYNLKSIYHKDKLMNKELITMLHLNLTKNLAATPQAGAMELQVALPHGVDITQPLKNEEYQMWRDKFVHEFWTDQAWIARDNLCPVNALVEAHSETLGKN